jgi:hypothetical protein
MFSPWRSRNPARLDERVEAQCAIEAVYYAHQIGAVDPFDVAVPRQMLEDKVRTFLKQTVALETFWMTAITAEALNDDSRGWRGKPGSPGVFGSCTTLSTTTPCCLKSASPGRPWDRLARNFFEADGRIHAAPRRQTEELRECLSRM